MTHDHQSDAVVGLISRLVCSSRVHIEENHRAERLTYSDVILKHENSTIGYAKLDDGCLFWFKKWDGRIFSFHVSRRSLPPTKEEVEVLSYIRKAMIGLDDEGDKQAIRNFKTIASGIALEFLLVVRFLRRSQGTQFWTVASILSQLQDLTFTQYEGYRATTGVVYSPKPNQYLKLGPPAGYAFDAFEGIPVLDDNSFKQPASYRYVDGRNAFYLVDNARRVHGVLRCIAPSDHSLSARIAGRHVEPLLANKQIGKQWVAVVGSNNDINVFTARRAQLRWLRNHWYMVSKNLISDVLVRNGMDVAPAAVIRDLVFMLSDLRRGALLLVLRDISRRPARVGRIDDSDLGRSLAATVKHQTIETLVQHGTATGVLTSDGLTTLDVSGRIVDCGGIIDVSELARGRIAGGGRTQAAAAASAYGVVIKVSEDGPVSVFDDGNEIIKIMH